MWVPKSVLIAGSGLSSTGAWYSASVGIEKDMVSVVDSSVRVFVADVAKTFDTVFTSRKMTKTDDGLGHGGEVGAVRGERETEASSSAGRRRLQVLRVALR